MWLTCFSLFFLSFSSLSFLSLARFSTLSTLGFSNLDSQPDSRQSQGALRFSFAWSQREREREREREAMWLTCFSLFFLSFSSLSFLFSRALFDPALSPLSNLAGNEMIKQSSARPRQGNEWGIM